MKHVQEFCKEFRSTYLKLTLEDVHNKFGINIKTLSSFENGRSTNINHLNTYYLLCENQEQRSFFIRGFDKAMNQDNLTKVKQNDE